MLDADNAEVKGYRFAVLFNPETLFEELGELPEQIQTELQLPPGDTLVQVFLFETQEKFDAFVKSEVEKLAKVIKASDDMMSSLSQLR